jgi:tRNA(fMet)-specific endonuclease VapC
VRLTQAALIFDTCVLIAEERRRGSIRSLLRETRNTYGEIDIALSAISVVELTHGIYRARTDVERTRRRSFCQEAFGDLIVYPVTLEIAQLAGRIEGEQAAKGVAIPFEDLVIGATAIHLGFAVATLNVKHFQLIPGLQTVTM